MSNLKISVNEILSMMEAGKTREEIRQHYSSLAGQPIPKTQWTAVFKHEKLKGRKVSAAPVFELVDETEEEETSESTSRAIFATSED